MVARQAKQDEEYFLKKYSEGLPGKWGNAMMGSLQKEDVLHILQELSQETRELNVADGVDRVPRLSAVEFLRGYVGPNKPVLLTDAVGHWPAHTLWTDEYLVKKVGDQEVTVALTPNGRADAVTQLEGPAASPVQPDGSGPSAPAACASQPRDCFALPAQQKMSLRDFFALFYTSKHTGPGPGQQAQHAEQGEGQQAQRAQQGKGRQAQRVEQGKGQQVQQAQHAEQDAEQQGQQKQQGEEAARVVPYLQFQNSSLLRELPQLLEDVDEHLPWATQAFGALPEAVNIWIGDERSTTSFHKDHFENLYGVVAGSKTFVMLPPSDVFRMRLRRYRTATYAPQAGAGSRLMPALHDPPEEILWSSVLPEECCGPCGTRDSRRSRAGPGVTSAAGQQGCAAHPAGCCRSCECGEAGGAARSSDHCSGSGCSGVEQRGLAAAEEPHAEGPAEPGSADNSRRGRGGGSSDQQAPQPGASSAPGPAEKPANAHGSCWAGDLFASPDLPSPIRVTVRPGELLYLPAIWWHQVEQQADESGRVIAVNYWYDMKFDVKYAHYKAVEALSAAIGLAEQLKNNEGQTSWITDGMDGPEFGIDLEK